MGVSDPQVLVAVVSTIGGVVIAYIVNVIGKRRKAAEPKNYMEIVLDGYEQFIRDQRIESDRKTVLINSLQAVIDKQKEEIDKSQKLMDQLKSDLEASKIRNDELQNQLNNIKLNYAKEGKEAING